MNEATTKFLKQGVKIYFAWFVIVFALTFVNGFGFNYSELNTMNFALQLLSPISHLYSNPEVLGIMFFVDGLLITASIQSLIQFKKHRIKVIVILLFLHATPFVVDLFKIDKCLDKGGRWNYLSSKCNGLSKQK